MTFQSSDFNVCILGGINIDFFSVVKDMPVAGETIVGSDFFVTPGGKGANQAVACSRLGLNTTMIGRVGNDDFANNLIENFKNENISVEGIFKDNSTDSVNLSLKSPSKTIRSTTTSIECFLFL